MTTANKGIDEKLFSYLINLLGNTPFYKFLGMKIRNIGQGESELFIDIEPHHENIIKGVHYIYKVRYEKTRCIYYW